ncbi:hypothetical protein ACFC3F_07085 [Microbacterium sp. NPDC055910]|uniref:hypothetical protein n=1 Tax=Microbacterium sp. NPDC055910 TaxID=3345659 RepID=UPI0035E17FAA
MKRNVVSAAGGLLVVGLLVAGCAGQADAPASTPPPATTGSTATQDPAPSPTPESTGTSSTAGAVDELRDGTWQVGDAGEVEFSLQNGSLALVEVRPADGWQQRISDEDSDEIEVYFTRDNTRWKFEVELERGTMEISQELKITRGAGGTYPVGSAAVVAFDTDGSTLTLGSVDVSDGWAIVKQDESADDIELDFRNDGTNGSAEFEAELEDGGVDIEISQKLTGPIPG